MGREARRVPLDFDWPQGEVWKGYLMPDRLREAKCPDCELGMTPDGDLIQGLAYLLVGLADDVTAQEQGRDMHPYLRSLHDIAYVHGKPRPTPRFMEFFHGLLPEDRDADGFLGRQPHGMARRLIELAGLDEKWDWCPTCKGHASVEKYPGQRAEAEAWEYEEPPTGEGWQMWETTSEGSPMSPVFATASGLANWLASNGASTFADATASSAEWLAIITGEEIAHIEVAPGVWMI